MCARREFSSRYVQTAVRNVLPGELAKHAVSEVGHTDVAPLIFLLWQGVKARTRFRSTCRDGWVSTKENSDMRSGLMLSTWPIERVTRAFFASDASAKFLRCALLSAAVSVLFLR